MTKIHKHIQYLAEDAGMDELRLPHGYELCLAGEESIERFALSLIKQCVAQIMADCRYSSDEWDRSILNSAHNVKQYFGVDDE